MMPMIILHVLATYKRDEGLLFEERLRQVVGEATLLPGCTRYEWFRSPRHDCQVFICGEFESEDAFLQYQKGPIVKMIGEQLIPLLAASLTFKHFRAVVLERSEE